MDEQRHYTVVAYNGPYDVRREQGVSVAAGSPEDAAKLIMGEELIPFGRARDLRAKVSFADLQGNTKVTLLYRKPTSPMV